MISVDQEKAMIYGDSGASARYSIMDGMIDYYNDDGLTDAEVEEADIELKKMIEENAQ